MASSKCVCVCSTLIQFRFEAIIDMELFFVMNVQQTAFICFCQQTSRDKQSVYRVNNPNCTVCAWNIYRTIVPFARYTFSATCNFDFYEGPAVRTQVITKEAGKITYI